MDHCRRVLILILNRSLIFLTAGLSYSSWSGWYEVFEVDKNLTRKLVFTVTVLVALFFVSIWYHRHQKWLQQATDELLAEKEPANLSRSAESDGDGDEDPQYHVAMVHLAALLEKSFENITSVMGFVLAEAWSDYLTGSVHHHLLASAALGAVGLALMVVFTVAQRAVDRNGNCHAYLELLSQMVLGSMAWFISVPMKDLLRLWSGVPMGDPAPVWLGLIAFFVALLFLSVSTWLMARCCWVDEAKKENDLSDGEDGEEVVTSMEDAMGLVSTKRRPLCEQGVVLYQNVWFNVAAALLKDWLLAGGHDGLTLTLFTIVLADVLFICLDNHTQLPQDADEAKKRAWRVRFRTDAVALTTRMAAYLASHVFGSYTLSSLDKNQIGWKVTFSVVTQIVAVICEELRMHCIVRKGLLANVGSVWEVMEEEEEDDDASSGEDSTPRPP